MAKLNLNSSNEENPLVVAIFGSFGILTCLIVTVLGIKLWWFKHRLSFEQSTIQNGAAGGATPNVVTRREKKTRFSKDKRWSQQIYHNVEVHGVFKQKKEDDSLIQGSTQLPPVRIRQAESAPSLLLPPPRNKRRPQYVQSTAFEELSESYTEPAGTASHSYSQENLYSTPVAATNLPSGSTNLSVPDINITTPAPEISLKFEEVEKDFVLPKLAQDTIAIGPEAPIPPKRINRSSSTSAKQESVQEKPHRFLKSSQSLSVPEFRKVIERRPTGFHRPNEIDDLTKIDDLEEPPFEKFGDRRPTGYIKYEEVDFEADLGDYRQDDLRGFYDSGYLESQTRYVEPIEALRDEEIIYKNPTSPDICEINEAIENYEKSSVNSKKQWGGETHSNDHHFNSSTRNYYGKEDEEGSRCTNFDNSSNLNDLVDPRNGTFENQIQENPVLKQRRPTGFVRNESDLDIEEGTLDYKEKSQENIVSLERGKDVDNQSVSTALECSEIQFESDDEEDSSQQNVHFLQNDYEEKFTLNHRRPTEFLKSQDEEWMPQSVNFDVNFSPSPEIEEKFMVNQNKSIEYTRSLDEIRNGQDIPETSVRFNDFGPMEVAEDKFTLNQRRPTAFIKSTLADEHNDLVASVKFDQSSMDVEDKFTLNQRRPTSYNRFNIEEDKEYEQQPAVRFVNLSDGTDTEDKFTLNQRSPTSYSRSNMEVEDQQAIVRFDNALDSDYTEDKFTLNQRRPTAFVRTVLEDEDMQPQGPAVRFANTLELDEMEEKFTLNQRRPTEFIRLNQETCEEEDLESETKVRFENSGYFTEDEDKFTLNQRRPTAYITNQYEELEENQTTVGNKVTFNLKQNDLLTQENGIEDKFTLNQRRPTKYNNNNQEDVERMPTKYNNNNQEDVENISFAEDVCKNHIKETDLDNVPDLLQVQRSTGLTQLNSSKTDNHDLIWQELEKDIERDFVQNIEEEFARIRQSLELNEADFLELKDDLEFNSPTLATAPKAPNSFLHEEKPNGFGKTIDDDWENFEKLKTPERKFYDLDGSHHEAVQITYNEVDKEAGVTTVSILKESKFESNDDNNSSKPRKSKVTFDFKTEEHVIPARKSPSDEDDSDDYDDGDDIYDRPPPPIPMQRLTSLNYSEENYYEPVVVPPTTISLFGSLRSPTIEKNNEDEFEDSWSAIRKHRQMTSQFQNLTLDTSRSPPPSYPPPPLPATRNVAGERTPKPAYRNPMAQLAAQRSKEVSSDLDGFKGRSIRDAKKRTSQEVLNLRDDFDDTEA